MVCNPWGEQIAVADEHEQVMTADIDLDEVKRIRARMPVVSSLF
jgi:predicted amidohydrolase